ncbi:MAG: Cytochrome peroxidase [Labilithrix sp.]|nr:Cytochrome peroxidase [Labilithrix sp.]
MRTPRWRSPRAVSAESRPRGDAGGVAIGNAYCAIHTIDWCGAATRVILRAMKNPFCAGGRARLALAPLAACLLAFAACEEAPPARTPKPASAGAAAPSASAGATLFTPERGAGEKAPEGEVSLAHVPKDLPLGVSPLLYAMAVPPQSVPSPAQIALGDKLFNDKRLSADDSVSCATCHDPKTGFTDHKTTAEGIKKQRGQRNSPTVLNAMFGATQFWDGRAATLEAQAKLPILNPIEMGMRSDADVVAKVQKIPEYAASFKQVFGRDVTFDDLAVALAAFERTQYSGTAPFDRFIQGDEKALNDAEKRGWALFNGKGRCNTCHAGNAVSPLFSDQKFHNIGIAAHKQDFPALAREAVAVVNSGNQKQVDELAIESKFSELGRFLVTKQTNDVGAFKTPTLRNVGITAPYMHDGSMDTLWDVMDHYNKGGVANPFLDGGMQRLGLSENDVDDLVAFMGSLTSDKFAAYGKQEMARMQGQKGKRPQRDMVAANGPNGSKGDLGDIAPDPDLKVKNPASNGVFGTYDVANGGK